MEILKFTIWAVLLLSAFVTLVDIVLVHWILRKHRLYKGRGVLASEITLVVASLSIAAIAIHVAC